MCPRPLISRSGLYCNNITLHPLYNRDCGRFHFALMAFGGFTNQSLGKIVSPDYSDPLVSACTHTHTHTHTHGPVNRIDNTTGCSMGTNHAINKIQSLASDQLKHYNSPVEFQAAFKIQAEFWN